ncbi:putative lipoprotein [Streptomyces sp. 1-11]|nr:putative lipoprotein [Streptomyces sp. 1-11]
MVVHGEREVLPAAGRAEAARALRQFTDAYNRADKAYDRSLDAKHVTGALADIDGARLTAGHANSPSGNANHSPLELTDAKFTIPKKAGWPRWFVADAKANKGGDARWLLVFTRDALTGPWQVAYLTLVAPGDVPQFKKDADGWAEAVPAGAEGLTVPPAELSKDYASHLKSGGNTFADGPYTSVLRANRKKLAKRPGLVRQFIDEPLTGGDYAPLALRTADGGALVFFSTHHYEKQTAAVGTSVPAPNRDVRALTKGEIKQSLTLEIVANEAALDPAGGGRVSVLGRVQGLTAAQGE